MEIIVGREGNQPFTIDNTGVSRHHVKLTDCGNGTFIIEDLSSSNGTFVNDQKIIKKTIALTDKVRLGPTYILNLGQVFKTNRKNPGLSTEQAQRLRIQITRLRQVRERYEQGNIALKREAAASRVKRTIPPLIVTAGLLICTIFVKGETANILRLAFGIISLLLIGYTTFRYYQTQTNTPEKLEALKKQYQIDYVCPNCGAYLGDLPFETILNQKKCNKCKIEWI